MTIKDLVQKYHANRDSYLKATYNEAQLRTDFLDPFFELLGWDIKNTLGKSTNEREVLLSLLSLLLMQMQIAMVRS